jgi:HK97 family phage portal protein
MGILRDIFWGPRVERQTEMSTSDLFETQIGDFWANLTASAGFSSPTLIERVWVANRCQHMNSTALSTMPLRHFGGREPAWVANPDPAWYPNGIVDVVYAMVDSFYGYGDAFLYITSRYADGYPSGFTVLDPSNISVEVRGGVRRYRAGQVQLNEQNVVQISRDPRAGSVRGTSAIKSYSAYSNGLLAAADLGRVMMGSGGTPNAVIKSVRKIDADQASAIQAAWMTAVSARRGAPAVLGPDLSFEQLAFSPADLMLLDAQKFDAQVLANAYGVPAQLLNMALEGLTYSTPILALELWWRTELRTTATRIASALGATMLPRGQWVEFDSREFLAPSFKELVEAWKVVVTDMGAASAEEFRTGILKLAAEQGVSLEDIVTPASAGASPAQQPANVAALRPSSNGSSY